LENSGAPEKIHLIPDDYHLERVGRLPDGRLIYQETQVSYDGKTSLDFAVTYVFDQDGNLVEDLVTLVGARDKITKADWQRAELEHEQRFGEIEMTDIWVRPFSLERHGLVFGLVPVAMETVEEDGVKYEPEPDDLWRVEAMPGNTLSFYAPWEDGEYDT